jgi:hypothetical protein
MEIASGYSKNLYSAQLNKHVYVLKEKDLSQKQKLLAHCFPVCPELVYQRNSCAI